MSVGEQIWDALVELERKFWNREDYSEEDIPLLSNVIDYIDADREDFIKYFNDRENRQ